MTDDDVLVALDYLDGIRAVFSQDSVAIAQGRVFLECPGGRPHWMNREMVYVLAGRDYGDQAHECKKDLVGVNLVVRARVFQEIGGFRTDLGPGSVGLCEDTEFTQRVHQAGLRVIYTPQIVVRHRISPARLTKSAMRRYYFTLGRSLACYTPLPAPLWRFSLYALKQLLRHELGALWLLARGRPAEALHGQCTTRMHAGMCWQSWQLKGRGLPPPVAAASTPANQTDNWHAG
jgi:GT2 family glycosyltransferase